MKLWRDLAALLGDLDEGRQKEIIREFGEFADDLWEDGYQQGYEKGITASRDE